MAGILWAGAGRAAVFLNENFDGYADQAAFQVAWPINGTASTLLNTEQSVSRANRRKG